MSTRILVKTLRPWLAALWLLLSCGLGWAADQTVGSYTLVSSKRISATVFEYAYRAQVTNSGVALKNVVGTVISYNPATVIVEGTLSFGDVAAASKACPPRHSAMA